MKMLTLQMPDSVDEKDLKMKLAAYWFSTGMLSSGKAAELTGLTKREFLESVGKYGASVFGETVTDLEQIFNA